MLICKFFTEICQVVFPIGLLKNEAYGLLMADIPNSRFLDRTTPPKLITLVLTAGLAALSLAIFVPSLPKMAEHFGTDYAVMQLSIAGYFLVTGTLQLIIGPLSDRYGRRPVLLWGILIFVIATIGAIYAPNVETFLAFRMAQGGIATGMVLSRAVVRDLVPGPSAASMIAYVTMGMAIFPMIGPIVGGYLGETFGWQTTFWFLATFGAVMLGLVFFDLGESNSNRSESFSKQFAECPELFGARRYWGFTLTTMFCSGTFFSYLGGAPQVANQVYALSETQTGAYLGLISLGYFFGNYYSGRNAERLGIFKMMIIGCWFATTGIGISIILVALGAASPLAFFGCVVAVGFGNGLALPSATVGLMSVRPSLAGTAAGVGGAMMVFGGGLLSGTSGFITRDLNSALPLAVFMFLISAMSIVFTYYTRMVQRQYDPEA